MLVAQWPSSCTIGACNEAFQQSSYKLERRFVRTSFCTRILVSPESATMTSDYASYLLHTVWIEFVAMEDKLNEEARNRGPHVLIYMPPVGLPES